MLYDLVMGILSVSLITAVVLSTIKKKTTSSKNKKIAWAITGLFFVLSAITAPAEEKMAGEKPEPTPTITKTITPKPKIDPIDSWKKYRVNWNEYGDQLPVIIKNDFYAKDCQSLQDTFDLAVYTNQEHMDQYGHNNANLMNYIDHLLRAANCYN